MRPEDFKPRSKLVTTTTLVDKPKFPVVDAHNHFAEPFGGGWDKKPLNQLLDLLDEACVTHYVDLDGGWGEEILYHHLDTFKAKAPERFQIFGGVDWSQWKEMGNRFPEGAASRLRVSFALARRTGSKLCQLSKAPSSLAAICGLKPSISSAQEASSS